MVGVLASSRIVDEVYSKPPAFTMIRKNVYLTQVKPKKAEGALCSCSKQCGPNCLNRALRIACIGHGMHVDEATGLSTHSGRVTAYDTCNVGAGCGNRSIQQRKCPALQPFKTHQRGWGLRAAEDVKAGQFVIEYVGEVRRGGTAAGLAHALHCTPPVTRVRRVCCVGGRLWMKPLRTSAWRRQRAKASWICISWRSTTT